MGKSDYKKLLQDKEYVGTVAYIQEKVRNDLSGQVLQEIGPIRSELKKYREQISRE